MDEFATASELKDMLAYMKDLNDPKYENDIIEIETNLMILKVCNNGKTLKDSILTAKKPK